MLKFQVNLQFSKTVVSIIASALALAMVALFAALSWDEFVGPFYPASYGAAAVIMFMSPNSPMASYRSFFLGNTVSACIGCVFYHSLGSDVVTALGAVCLSILAMYALKCMHPPGGATALLFTTSGDDLFGIHGYSFLLLFTMSLICFGSIVWFHRSFSNEKVKIKRSDTTRSIGAVRRAIMALDFSSQITVKQTLQFMELVRRLSNLSLESDDVCGDLPTTKLWVNYDTHIEDALRICRDNGLDVLPVLDKCSKPIGQFCIAALEPVSKSEELEFNRLIKLYRYQGTLESRRPEYCGQVMRPIKVVHRETDAIDVILNYLGAFCVVDDVGSFEGLYTGV